MTTSFGQALPDIASVPPGPESLRLAERLAEVESRNVTFLADDWPVFWADARGSNVRDVDGNVYIDLTSAFGVAFLGHRPEVLVEAMAEETLIHGMGDIHPPARKVELLARLAEVAPFESAKTLLANTGSEAVEAALKTAWIASGKPGVIAFEGGYHGLTLGSLAMTERAHFRAPFAGQAYAGVSFLPFPGPENATDVLSRARAALERGAPNGDPIGSIIVEPVQARGGARVPPPGFMDDLSTLAHEYGALVIADEIFTGLGRCGAWFASTRVGLSPDIVTVGKTLGAGLPISACIAPAAIMDAWPESSGEAIHTSTFLGHPLACGAGIRALEAIETGGLAAEAERVGEGIAQSLRDALTGLPGVREVRGLGLLLGIAFERPDGTPFAGHGARVARALLRRGLIALPAGDQGEVLELSPPVSITTEQVAYAVQAIRDVVEELQ